MSASIFCPACGELMLAEPTCPRCGWSRLTKVGEPLWQAALDPAPPLAHAAPSVTAGIYCLAADDGELLALEVATGAMRWRRRIDSEGVSVELAAAGARVLASAADMRPVPAGARALLALDATSGAELWRCPTATHSLSAPVIAGEMVIFTAASRTLYALNIADGTVRWRREHPHWGPAAPAADEDVLVTGGRDLWLRGFNLSNGESRWSITGQGWFAGPIAVAGGRAYTLCWDGHLYAVDTRSGELLWHQGGERSKGFCGPPCADRQRVFIGDRVYGGGQRRHDYALRALDAATGAELWRRQMPRPVEHQPALLGNALVCVAGDRCVALDALSGQVHWQCQLDDTIVTRPVIEDGLLLVITRRGTVWAIQLLEPLGAATDPEWALERGDWAAAAVSLALRGDLIAAAELYERQGRPHEAGLLLECGGQVNRAARLLAAHEPLRAAALFERGNDPLQAAQLLLEAGEPLRAAALFERAGDQHGRARALAAGGQIAAAADLYALVGEQERAATLYEAAGDLPRAAEHYRTAACFDESQRLWARLGKWELQVEDMVAAGQLVAAAQTLSDRGRPELAADLLAQAGELAGALTLFHSLSNWEQVAALAARLDEPLQEAQARELLGQPERAAALYTRAGERRRDPAEASGLYERAMGLYLDAGNDAQAEHCRKMILRLRREPELTTVARTSGALIEYTWNSLTIEFENSGYGAAFNLTIAVEGSFESQRFNPIARLAAGQKRQVPLSVRARRGEYGPAVPLVLSVSYTNEQGVTYQTHEHISIAVQAADGPSQRDSSVEITVRPATSVPTAPSEKDELVLSLHFTQLEARGSASIRWEAEALGTPRSQFRSPFVGRDLELVIRALDHLQAPRGALDASDLARLAALGLPVLENFLDPSVHSAVGRSLYGALVADPHGAEALSMVRSYARAEGRPLTLHLRFPPDAIELAALPWELLWDKGLVPMLLDRGQLVGCTRYLDLPMPSRLSPAQPSKPLRLLAVTPHAGVDPTLRAEERVARHSAWGSLIEDGSVVMDEVGPATPGAIFDQIQAHPPDIVHFVGHGIYQDERGSLILDRLGGGWEPMPVDRLVPLFSQARLVVLQACQSAMIGEAGLFTGVAPALSAAGVAAVVAMQLTVRASAAVRFTSVLYRDLASGKSLQQAVGRARQALYFEESDGASWYVPTLTLSARHEAPIYLVGP